MSQEIQLPHHKLIAYEVAKELLVAVRQCQVAEMTNEHSNRSGGAHAWVQPE